MNAPKRILSETGDATRGERDLLRAASPHDPPPGAQNQIWTALLAQLPPPPPGGGSSSGSSGTASASGPAASGGASLPAAVGGGLLKSALIGAGSALALVSVYTAVAPPDPAPSAPPPALLAPIEARAPLPSGPAPTAILPVAPAASAVPSASASARPADALPAPSAATITGAEPSPAERASRLQEESQRLGEARDALRRGDPAAALARLTELRQRFPFGVLAQEREALTIEALAKSGDRAEAKARADAFQKAYPGSPHGTRVEALTEPPSPK